MLAICYNDKLQRLLNLSYGVIPVYQKEHIGSEKLFLAAVRMLRQKGYVELEDKIAYLSGNIGAGGATKFLEINTRAWKWHTISNQLGFSFIGALIDWFDGVNQKCPTMNPKDKVAWVERLTDWTVIAKEILHGRMRLSEVGKSYEIKHESAVWSWRDPMPGIMYILLSPILYVKRH